MHPAYSVLVFTTFSGAGYGLLIWLSFALLTGAVGDGDVQAFVMLALGLALVTTGLLSSTFHLGRPERAMKAFSQWRTSWLSREGVLAVATYIPAGLLGLGWLMVGADGVVAAQLALLLLAGSVATVWCTGMIYASLPTIRAWNHPLVAPGYVILALATGGVLYIAIRAFAEWASAIEVLVVLAAVLAAWGLKGAYWGGISSARKSWTAGSATGLGMFGKVRVVEAPHSQANFVMREMGYSIARKHADKLRQMVVATLFLVPIVGLLVLLAVPGPLGLVAALVAVVSSSVGVFVERWLFFAEAQHVVTLYYGAEAA